MEVFELFSSACRNADEQFVHFITSRNCWAGSWPLNRGRKFWSQARLNVTNNQLMSWRSKEEIVFLFRVSCCSPKSHGPSFFGQRATERTAAQADSFSFPVYFNIDTPPRTGLSRLGAQNKTVTFKIFTVCACARVCVCVCLCALTSWLDCMEGKWHVSINESAGK